jgi:hypothetical protein
MNAADYVNVYLNLYVGLEGNTSVRIRNYLQAGQGNQSANAQRASGQLTAALSKKLGRSLPPEFEFETYRFSRASLERTFIGKGAPDELQDTLWLAAECEMFASGQAQLYADMNLGIDCGGFVANYWGIGHPGPGSYAPFGSTGIKPRTFWEMNRSLRRAHASQIEVNDAAIFFKDVKNDDVDIKAQMVGGKYDSSTGSQAFHIGLVGAVSWRPGTDDINLTIVESSGGLNASSGGNGVRVRPPIEVPTKVPKGYVFCADGSNRIYFVGPPRSPQPYWAYE